MLVLEEHEGVKYKHEAKFEKVDGDLVLTDLRVYWEARRAGGSSFQFLWLNVEDVKYAEPSKKGGKAGWKLKLSNSSKTDAMFFLTGGENLSADLEHLKRVVKEQFQNKKKEPVDTAVPAPNEKKRSRTQTLIDKNSVEAERTQALQKRRTELLDSDSKLMANYKNFVVSKVLSEDEFWQSHMPDNEAYLFSSEADDHTIKARLPLKSRIVDGNLTLTPEDIRDILEDDVVKRAYLDLVPDKKTEHDFWKLYINKYYCRNTQSVQADHIFARYQRKNPTAAGRQSQGKGSSSSKDTTGAESGGENTSTNTSTSSKEFDLTNKTGSWREDSQFSLIDSIADVDHQEHFDSEDRKQGPAATEGPGKIIASNSKRVLPTKSQKSQNTQKSSSSSRENELLELQNVRSPAYIHLKINSAQLLGEEEENVPTATGGGAFGKGKPSAFGKSSTVNRGFSSSFRKRMPVKDPACLLASLRKVIPNSERADQFMQTSLLGFKENAASIRRISFTDVAAAEEMALDMAAFGLTPLDGLKSEVIDLSAADGDHLPLALKAELIEIFAGITEGLRHFYSILGKEGKSAPSTGSEAAGKVDKILKMLEIKREQLAAKKARAKGDSSLSMESKDAAGKVISELDKLVNRAKAMWSSYNNRLQQSAQQSVQVGN